MPLLRMNILLEAEKVQVGQISIFLRKILPSNIQISTVDLFCNSMSVATLLGDFLVLDFEFEEFISRNIPLGRIGQVQEVADLVFAYSNQEFSNYSTGVRINLDGGTSINL